MHLKHFQKEERERGEIFKLLFTSDIWASLVQAIPELWWICFTQDFKLGDAKQELPANSHLLSPPGKGLVNLRQSQGG